MVNRYALPDMSVDVTQMQLAVQVLQEAGLVQTDPFPVSRLWGGEANLAVALRNHITTPTQKQRQSSDAKVSLRPLVALVCAMLIGAYRRYGSSAVKISAVGRPQSLKKVQAERGSLSQSSCTWCVELVEC